MTAVTAPVTRNAFGALLLTLSWIFFTTELISARLLAPDLSVSQIAVFRLLPQALIFVPIVLMTRGEVIRTRRLRLHLTRAGFSSVGMMLFYLSFAFLPVAVATTLSFTQAIWLIALAALVLHERIGPRRIGAAVAGFIGVLVVMRPGVTAFDPAMLYPLAAALAAACLMTVTRRLSATESRLTIMFYSAWLGLAFIAIPTGLLWQPIRAEHWPLLAVVGVTGTIGQFLMVGAFQVAEASALAPVDYVRLVFAVLAGYFLFAEIPDMWTWIGSAIIIGSVGYVTHRERQLSRACAATSPASGSLT